MTAEGSWRSATDADEVAFVDCVDVDAATLERFYRDVMEPSFRPDELTGFDLMRTAYQTPLPGAQGTLAMRSGEPVAGALGEFDSVSGIMLLAYLAVRADLRGQGIGSALLAHVLPRWRAANDPVAILAEVEDPRSYAPGPYGDPVARLRMYGRTGWRLLPLPYFQPALRPGLARVHGMLLICFAAEDAVVPVDDLLAFTDGYMRSCEGEEAVLNDPDYLAFRDRVKQTPAGVPLWPTSRAHEVPAAT
ncbi:GNAT family N-acetyltransferase [Actinomadura sp. HBU206391]|uniref:GNAT family N-acetyltransferase n=1 Tax=Actinomadura sp. HBU206391 TaxID=2731692 RepID=UPI0016502B23|nr:GNAT family N-acetyltransferase [Actinomadura sp. HBU206391]MBC6460008.1 GNAT family N-acetyltransferase [Actinomadura sp. HBU206391]